MKTQEELFQILLTKHAAQMSVVLRDPNNLGRGIGRSLYWEVLPDLKNVPEHVWNLLDLGEGPYWLCSQQLFGPNNRFWKITGGFAGRDDVIGLANMPGFQPPNERGPQLTSRQFSFEDAGNQTVQIRSAAYGTWITVKDDGLTLSKTQDQATAFAPYMFL